LLAANGSDTAVATDAVLLTDPLAAVTLTTKA
jgi:hypothetical protein